MRIALAIGVALVCCACSAESRLRPRNPVNASLTDPTCVAAPAIQDSFPKAFAASQTDDAYRVERPQHIDLGYIGDSPIGTEPNPPHADPPWEQPFTLDCQYTGCARRRACPALYVVPVISQ
jgi:hypothetical protein